MKKFLFIIVCFMVSIMIQAGEVSSQEALEKARQFMPNKDFKQQSDSRRKVSKNGSANSPYYVFNAENNGGFVIVSGDDRTETILGYADCGCIDFAQMHPNLKAWLENYAEQINALDVQTSSIRKNPRKVRAAIAPLIKSQWNQESPYNLQCPIYNEELCETGCVATAMAQLMYYHKWPQEVTSAIPAYSKNGLSLDELPIIRFQWGKMKDVYSFYESGEAALAVAELMRYCGQSVQMSYSPNGSSAHVDAQTMKTYFGYSNSTQDIRRSDYTTDEWEQIIYDEVAAGRPVLYSGSNSYEGGHEFVCDGYDGNGLFHINWGWGSACDGFFVLSLLNSTSTKVDGMSLNDAGFTLAQEAIIGVKPKCDWETYTPTAQISDVNLSSSQFIRASSKEDFQNVTISSSLYSKEKTGYVNHAWALYKDNEKISVYGRGEVICLNPSSPTVVNTTISFGAGWEDGEYILYDVYSSVGNDNWRKSYGAGNNCIIAMIKENVLSLQKISGSEDDLVLSNVSVNGIFKPDRHLTISLDITNQGYSHEQTLYLWGNNGTKYNSSISTYIDHNQTQKCTLYYNTPSVVGNIPLKITTDCLGNKVLWSGFVTIEEGALIPEELSVTYDVTNTVFRNTIRGTTMKANVVLTNTGLNNYNDMINIVTYQEKDDGWTCPVNYQYYTTTIAAGETKTIPVEIEGLKIGGKYGLSVWYYSENKYKYCRIGDYYTIIPENETLQPYAELNRDTGTLLFAYKSIELGEDVFEVPSYNVYDDYPDWSDECRNIKKVIFDGSFINAHPTSTRNWFIGCSNLESIEGIENLNTSEVIDTESMFAGCSSLSSLDLSGFNTANVTDMSNMFGHCSSLSSLDLSGFNTANVTDMGNMFSGCSSLSSLDLSGFNTVNVNRMDNMFSGCSSLSSLDLSGFNMVNVNRMDYMFSGCDKMSTLKLPSVIPLINERWSLYSCTNLKAIQSNITDLSTNSMEDDVFTSDVYTSAFLYVPTGTKKMYQEAGGWKLFKNVIEGSIPNIGVLGDTNGVKVNAVKIPQGGTGTIDIELNNDDYEFTAFTFKLTLPEGLSFVPNNAGKPTFEKSYRFDDSHIVTSAVSGQVGFFGCLSGDKAAIKGTSGVLLKVYVKADTELAVGKELTATLSELTFTTTSVTEVTFNDVTADITIGEARILIDETSTTAPEAAENVDVRVKLTINANEWSTICLPFAMTTAQLNEAFGEMGKGWMLADFQGVESETDADENVVSISVNFGKATTIEANHPYLIKVSEAVSSFMVDGVDIAPRDEVSVNRNQKKIDNFYFYNRFVGTYVANTTVPDLCLFLSDNKFCYSNGATKMKAFSGYFDFYDVLTEVESPSASSRIFFVYDEGTTAIEEIYKPNVLKGAVYNLNGQFMGKDVDLKSMPKGIYIVDGKKVVSY